VWRQRDGPIVTVARDVAEGDMDGHAENGGRVDKMLEHSPCQTEKWSQSCKQFVPGDLAE
jgi:hypothetical protein